jgi:Asp-tRNA(Asn)/Glu-tRNA(Gln) amidotransferase A subunit family amidase
MPAISVPMGSVTREDKTLPVGIHFTAAHGEEEVLFKIGAAVTKEELY